MFGYIQINQQELKIKDYNKYRSYYCGLCHTLKSRYGRTGQMLLNYDMTFLAVLLTGLYECRENESKARCVPHPVSAHTQISNEAVEYAADMTVLLGYQKALDDWKDEHSHPKRLLAMRLYPCYRELRRRYPRQAKTLEECIRKLSAAEKEASGGNRPLKEGQQTQKDTDLSRVWIRIDELSALTGKFLGEIFVWKEDVWQEDLRQMGFYLGKFIYLADACTDLEKDRKKGLPNPLKEIPGEDGSDGSDEKIREMLEDMMLRSARAFERLPVLMHAELLRNVLYSGVWIKVTARGLHRQESRKAEYEQSI